MSLPLQPNPMSTATTETPGAGTPAAQPSTTTDTKTVTLRLSSANGPVTRTVLSQPPREALPHEIPIINISALTNPSATLAERQSIADQIRTAALTNGFFYITEHGIPASVTSAAHSSSLSFFRQPVEQKQPANAALYSKYNFGWKPPQSQRINPFEGADLRETFSWRYDPAYDPSLSADDVDRIPEEVKKYIQIDEGDFPWSATTKDTPEFKRDVIKLFQDVLELGRLLGRSFALSLGLDEHDWDGKFTYPGVGMAVNWYPPLPPSTATSPTNTEPAEKNVSIGSHTDFQLFTLLYQDPSSPATALQVLSRCPEAGRTPGGEEIYQWLYAKPIPGTFVVNFGDYMQRITNDRYPSTVHRVQNFLAAAPLSGINEERCAEEHNGERLSMAFFFGFNQDETVEVLDSCVDYARGEKKKYEAVSCFEWNLRRFKAMHDLGSGNVNGAGKGS
ncbi:2OG-Fe(II) oxygenase [Rhypophila decipiens]|uniref:2OG-Fe(II) oxygenase n=1 Tax=Rhypophila decipiens TaxID=261697 RepID=A0AAN6YBE8_9PEZI|nr:2OG-Fe(II) oxygenase [Rhypophila decipiens]